jgi:hypothetical protein
MNALSPINKTKLSPRDGAQPPRIGEPMRRAFKLRIEEGLTILAACEKAGVSEAGFHAAMKKPAVQALYERMETQFIQTVERRRAGYKARAYEVAADLMERAQSEAVRMRAVEFFAAEARQPGVVVQVNAGHSGYQYERPIDVASADHASQPTVIEGKASPVDE